MIKPTHSTSTTCTSFKQLCRHMDCGARRECTPEVLESLHSPTLLWALKIYSCFLCQTFLFQRGLFPLETKVLIRTFLQITWVKYFNFFGEITELYWSSSSPLKTAPQPYKQHYTSQDSFVYLQATNIISHLVASWPMPWEVFNWMCLYSNTQGNFYHPIQFSSRQRLCLENINLYIHLPAGTVGEAVFVGSMWQWPTAVSLIICKDL